MRVVRVGAVQALVVFGFLSSFLAAPAHADTAQDLDSGVRTVLDAAQRAADSVADSDRPSGIQTLASALVSAQSAAAQTDDPAAAVDLGRRRRRIRARLRRLVKKLEKAHAFAADPARDDQAVAKKVLQATRAGAAALQSLQGFSADVFVLTGKPRRKGGFHRPGSSAKVVFRPGLLPGGGPCSETPVVTVAPARAGRAVVDPAVEDLGDGTYRLFLGEDLGGVIVTATACGVTRTWRLFNWGPPGALRVDKPTGVAYPQALVHLRAGQEVPVLVPTLSGGPPTAFDATPALPMGVGFDPATGQLTGRPTTAAVTGRHVITASNARGSTSTTLDVQVTPALPDAFLQLADGFFAESVVADAEVPVKLARAPDGRVFYNELSTGQVRVIGADGVLRATPFASIDVQSGAERGLIGIAIAPDFATSGHVFVFASTPEGGGKPLRNRVLRLTATGDVGADQQVILDDLPIGFVHNGGDLQFGPDGKLYVSVGDTGDEANSQVSGGLGGRILRLEPDGSIPTDNPDPTSATYCLGLRNSFDLAFHPTTGGLFATENGPTANDELNLILPERNYEWGHADPESIPGFFVGAKLRDWTPVIVPTGIAWHDGAGFGPEFANNLILLAYDHSEIQRLVLSGDAFTDLDDEIVFAQFDAEQSVDNKPLDVLVQPDGSLLISTFAGIWRVDRFERRN